MARGGRRTGAPGKNYANRTDLALGPRKLPVTAAPGQPYGEAKAQIDAQQQVPITTGPDFTGAMTAAQQFTPPPVVPMGAPSMNPAEHVMTPAQPSAFQQSPVLKGAALLNALGDGASPEAKAIRDVLNATQANQATP